MERRTIVRFLLVKSLKTKEIAMELTIVYDDEALQIFAMKKCQTRFLQGRRELGNNLRSGRPAKFDLRHVITELI
jgi:hypothetical protein